MKLFYLDASAWVKRYYRETGTAWVQELFAQNPIVACSSLGLIEVMATLARKQKAGELDPLLFAQKAEELEEDWRQFIQIQLTAETADLARELARRLALPGADAVHLASALILARRLAVDEDQLVVITSDHELKEAAQRSGLVVIDPDEEERPAPQGEKSGLG
ncbi:MAG TPA: type II toxin-antitoxin system VapC family toxin [Dehalococcoidia bacterium]|nr:type II toxin-antitoxin system VapC family toxin [Dehalococcoidia bacterium]